MVLDQDTDLVEPMEAQHKKIELPDNQVLIGNRVYSLNPKLDEEFKIQYRHFGAIGFSDPTKRIYRATAAYMLDTDMKMGYLLSASYAICLDGDRYSKRKGRAIAGNRLRTRLCVEDPVVPEDETLTGVTLPELDQTNVTVHSIDILSEMYMSGMISLEELLQTGLLIIRQRFREEIRHRDCSDWDIESR